MASGTLAFTSASNHAMPAGGKHAPGMWQCFPPDGSAVRASAAHCEGFWVFFVVRAGIFNCMTPYYIVALELIYRAVLYTLTQLALEEATLFSFLFSINTGRTLELFIY